MLFFQVCISARSLDKLQELKSEINANNGIATVYQCDVIKREQVLLVKLLVGFGFERLLLRRSVSSQRGQEKRPRNVHLSVGDVPPYRFGLFEDLSLKAVIFCVVKVFL